MNVYITNVTKNMDVSIRERTLKPGKGDVFSEEVSKQDGVVAFARKGWLKIEMVKESPEGIAAGIVTEPPLATSTGDLTVNDNTPTGQPVVSGNEQPQSGNTQGHDSAHTNKKKKAAQVV